LQSLVPQRKRRPPLISSHPREEAVSMEEGKAKVNNVNAELVAALGPVLLIILAGWLSVRLKLVSHSMVEGLSHFVTYFSLPCLLFRELYRFHWPTLDGWFFFAYFVGTSLVYAWVFLASIWFEKPVVTVHQDGAYSAVPSLPVPDSRQASLQDLGEGTLLQSTGTFRTNETDEFVDSVPSPDERDRDIHLADTTQQLQIQQDIGTKQQQKRHIPSVAAFNGMCAAFPNAVFMGMPLVRDLYSKPTDEYVIYCVLCLVISHVSVLFVSNLVIEFRKLGRKEAKWINDYLEEETQGKKSKRQRRSRYRKNKFDDYDLDYSPSWTRQALWAVWGGIKVNLPVLIPTVAGIIWSAAKWPYGPSIDTNPLAILDSLTYYLSHTAIGAALFTLGLSMYDLSLLHRPYKSLLLMFIKMWVCPVLVTMIMYCLDVEFELLRVGFIISMLPPAPIVAYLGSRCVNHNDKNTTITRVQ